MSYRLKSETVIGFVNKNVPELTAQEMDSLNPGMLDFILSEIRRHAREFYDRKKSKTKVYPDLAAEDRVGRHPFYRFFSEAVALYHSRVEISPERYRGVDVKWIETDLSTIEARAMQVMGMKKPDLILLDESFDLSGYEFARVVRKETKQPKLGAGKNPFAEPTIRSYRKR